MISQKVLAIPRMAMMKDRRRIRDWPVFTFGCALGGDEDLGRMFCSRNTHSHRILQFEKILSVFRDKSSLNFHNGVKSVVSLHFPISEDALT